MKTCAGYDSSAPKDVLEAIRVHVGNQKHGGERKHLDHEGCCMLQDLDGVACKDPVGGSECKYGGGTKVDIDKPKRPF
jgi:hypothetical protein